MKADFPQVYLSSDQPVTCPKCGARTDFVEVATMPCETQEHECLNDACRFSFVVESDIEEYI